MAREIIELSYFLPKSEITDIDEWKKLGFVFQDKDDETYYVVLPMGWHIEVGSRMRMFDEKNRIRAYQYNRLISRYDVIWDFPEGKTEVYFGNSREKLFVAGTIDKDLDKHEYLNQLYFLEYLATEYGNTHYPDWRNPFAYWDLEKEISDNQPKI